MLVYGLRTLVQWFAPFTVTKTYALLHADLLLMHGTLPLSIYYLC